MSISRIRTIIVIFACAIVLAGCQYPFEWAYHTAAGRPSNYGESPVISGASASPMDRPDAVCPDKPDSDLFAHEKDKGWAPTPCQAAILSAAIHECVSKVSLGRSIDPLIVMTGGAATAIVGLVTAKESLALAGGATILASGFGGTTKISDVFGGAAHNPVPDMLKAAQAYAQIYQNIKPARTRIYYAGLWNAAGSACPHHVLRNFEMAHFDVTDTTRFDMTDRYLTRLNNPKNFQPRTPATPTSFTITFWPGQGQLDLSHEENRTNLDKAVGLYQKNSASPTLTVIVVGSATEAELISRREISERRVRNVEEYLKGRGVDPTRIFVRGEKKAAAKPEVVIAIQP